jgi:hypothetical protein
VSRIRFVATVLGGVLLAIHPLPGEAQAADSTRLVLSRELLSVLGVNEKVEGVRPDLSKTREMLPQVPASVWDTLEARMRRALVGIQDSLAPLYAAKFTVEELRGFIAFFTTTLGRRYTSESQALTREAMEIMQRIVGRVTDSFVDQIMIRRSPPP